MRSKCEYRDIKGERGHHYECFRYFTLRLVTKKNNQLMSKLTVFTTFAFTIEKPQIFQKISVGLKTEVA